jgi:hypothetical protein
MGIKAKMISGLLNKLLKNRSNTGYSTGMWSDDDDRNPRITPVFGPNR